MTRTEFTDNLTFLFALQMLSRLAAAGRDHLHRKIRSCFLQNLVQKGFAESRSFNRLLQKTAFAFANAIFIIKAKKHPEDIH